MKWEDVSRYIAVRNSLIELKVYDRRECDKCAKRETCKSLERWGAPVRSAIIDGAKCSVNNKNEVKDLTCIGGKAYLELSQTSRIAPAVDAVVYTTERWVQPSIKNKFMEQHYPELWAAYLHSHTNAPAATTPANENSRSDILDDKDVPGRVRRVAKFIEECEDLYEIRDSPRDAVAEADSLIGLELSEDEKEKLIADLVRAEFDIPEDPIEAAETTVTVRLDGYIIDVVPPMISREDWLITEIRRA